MASIPFLDGVRVVTMAQNVPGPLAVARMRQAGARVTKVEPPSGDPLNMLSPAWYAELHAGISVERADVKSDAGRARVLTLLRDADLLITSQRPSVLQRLGIDSERLRSQLPDLRILRIFGSVMDPDAAGHDLTYQAQAGLVGREMPRTLLADVITSERAFAAALALFREPPGSVIDVGLVESLEPLVAPLRHRLTTPGGPLGGGAPQYRVYEAKSGRVAIAALEPHFETRLYQELGIPIRSDLSSRMLERTAGEWEAWARERDLPLVAVSDDSFAASRTE